MDTPDTGPRRFCRFRNDAPAGDPGLQRLPSDGMCLSVFLLVRPRPGAREVVMGKLAPAGDWARIGALDPGRIGRASGAWMLPSCHLALFESPEAAAARVAAEQLGVPTLSFAGPRVVSEAYDRGTHLDPHWDLHFLFEAVWPEGRSLASPAWESLRFLDPDADPRSTVARGHEDIVRLASADRGSPRPAGTPVGA